MSNFNDTKRNQINVAICGPVSAGKSTLLNSLFVASYSDMKLKRTTMTPQVYFETEKISKKDSESIKNKNREINERLYKKKPEELSLSDIEETQYMVPKVKDVVNLEPQVFLSVYDIPGLNDAKTKNVYFQYMDTNFYKFDVILFVVDINSALNTSDEIDILDRILTNSKQNFEKFGIHNKLVVVANKCDDINYNASKNKYDFLDEELEEMYQQIISTVEQRVESVNPNMDYKIVPLGSEDSYIYRMYDENPDYDLDIKHINKFGSNEYGKSRWNRLGEKDKKKVIRKLMEDMDIKDTLKHTGFSGFSKTLNKFLDHKNQYAYLMNHVVYGLHNITDFNKLDITEDVQTFFGFFNRTKEINQVYKRHIGKKCSNKVFHKFMNEYLEKYKTQIISQYIDVPNSNVKSESHLVQVEQIKNQFDKFSSMFNTESKTVEEIKTVITNSLNNFYVSNIKSKQKGVSALFEMLNKLVKNAFKVTKDLIHDIFSNNDMKTKTSEEVIKHLEDLESRKLIDGPKKMEILHKFIKEIYESPTSGNIGAIPSNMRACYFYHADIFWTRIMIKESVTDMRVNTLTFLSKKNMCSFITNPNQEFNDSGEEVLQLEYYLVDMMTSRHISNYSSKVKKSSGKKKRVVVSSESDSGNLSDEADGNLAMILNEC